jgi:hypothetical protein
LRRCAHPRVPLATQYISAPSQQSPVTHRITDVRTPP